MKSVCEILCKVSQKLKMDLQNYDELCLDTNVYLKYLLCKEPLQRWSVHRIKYSKVRVWRIPPPTRI